MRVALEIQTDVPRALSAKRPVPWNAAGGEDGRAAIRYGIGIDIDIGKSGSCVGGAYADEAGEDQRRLLGLPPGFFHVHPVGSSQVAGAEYGAGRVVCTCAF